MPVTSPNLSPAAALQQAIAACTAKGWQLTSANNNTATMTYSGVNHVLHGILSALTCGIWLLVWLFLVIDNRKHTLLILADEQGNITYQQHK